MKDKQVRKETLRKLLTINEEYCKKQARQIDSLELQLKITIKERNKYKDKHENFVSLRKELKTVNQENVKLSRVYAKKIGVLK